MEGPPRLEADNMHVCFVRLSLVLIALSIIYHRHSKFSIPLYAINMRPVLTLHIIAGLIELMGLHLQPLFLRRERIPNSLDLVLCFAQSGTNMALVKRMARGQWSMTRPSYQAGAVMRPVLTISAMAFQIPALHTSSLQIIHAFIYTRCLIYIWSKARLLDKHSDTYMVAVFSAAILAMADTPWPAILSKAYVLCVAGISLLNHWASKQIEESCTQQSTLKAYLLGLLLGLGLVDLPSLRRKQLPVMINDDYCDSLGPKSKPSTAAHSVVDRVSQPLDDDKIGSENPMITTMPAEEPSTPDKSGLASRTNTKVPVSESHELVTYSQATTIHSPVTIEDQISTSTALDPEVPGADTEDVPLSVDPFARVNDMTRTKRWRSALSLRGTSTSATLRDKDTSKTFKLGPRVLVNEIKASEDDSTNLEVSPLHTKGSSRRAIMYRMLERLKKEK